MSQPSEDILDDNFNEKLRKENPHKQKTINKIGIVMASFSFLFGTLLLLMAFTTNDILGMEVVIVGLFYLPIAFVVNLLYFIFLFAASGTSEEKSSYRKTAGIMSLNIPIAFIYFLIIMSNL